MSTFPAAHVAERLPHIDGDVFSLRCIDGKAKGEVSRADLMDLAEAGVVCGVGSATKFRYFQLTCDQEELENRLASALRDKVAHRAKRPIDFLVGMLSSRSFVRRSRVDVLRWQGGGYVASKRIVFEPDMQRCLAR